MIALASVDLPAPRSPWRATTSPGRSARARSSPRRMLAVSSGRKRVKEGMLFRRRTDTAGSHREAGGPRRAAAAAGVDVDRAAMQLYEALHYGKPQTRAAPPASLSAGIEALANIGTH